jgi:hypothetical protein
VHPVVDGEVSMETERKTFRWLAWIGAAVLAGALCGALVEGETRAAVVLGLFLAASVGFLATRDRLPALFDLLFVAASLVNAVGLAFSLYEGIPGYDEFAHSFTTFAVTLAFGSLAYGRMTRAFREHRPSFAVAIASLGLSVGALWEMLEWAADRTLGTTLMGGVDDTVKDLMGDFVGAAFAATMSAWLIHGREWSLRPRAQQEARRARLVAA